MGENLLRDKSYGDWESEMKNTLFDKNKIEFVDGTLPVPIEDSIDLINWRSIWDEIESMSQIPTCNC